MTKLLVNPVNLQNFNNVKGKHIDGFIFGIKDYSVFFNTEINIEEITNIKKNTNKDIYIAINKMIYNKDLENIRNILKDIDTIGVSGVIFEDLSILKIVKDLKLNINLIYNQIHFACNYYSLDYWKDKGINSVFLSTELMLKDYIDIKKNTNMSTFVYIYGHVPMFYSSRKLLTNYFNYIEKTSEKDCYYISEKNKDNKYLIHEKDDETIIYSDVINGLMEVKDLVNNNIDYLVLNGLNHDENEFNDVIDAYIKAINLEEVGNIYNNMKHKNKGFLFKESIYRVKL